MAEDVDMAMSDDTDSELDEEDLDEMIKTYGLARLSPQIDATDG